MRASLVDIMIEAISESRDKHEYRIEWEAFVLRLVFYSSVFSQLSMYPLTWFEDKAPLDVIVMSYARGS